MKLDLSNTFRERAEHCSRQSQLTKNIQLKKYWDDLAAEWLVLENADLGPDPLGQENPALSDLRGETTFVGYSSNY